MFFIEPALRLRNERGKILHKHHAFDAMWGPLARYRSELLPRFVVKPNAGIEIDMR